MNIKVTEGEINKCIDECNNLLNEGMTSTGMTFEEGVKLALEWILGYTECPVTNEDEDYD